MLQLMFQSLYVADGKPQIGLAVTIAGGLANVVLAYVFIAWFHMGIAGAAVATGIGYSIPALYGLWYFARNRRGNFCFVKPKTDYRALAQAASNGASEIDVYKRQLRFCVFPKHYRYNLKAPALYPYELRENSPWKPEDYQEEELAKLPRNMLGGIPLKMEQPETVWDFGRFCPEYFQNMEDKIKALLALGIEADLILLHPYDRWGFSRMSVEDENVYLQYVTARFSAFRNVWWSLANEYDLFREKELWQWEQNAQVLVREDPYCHLRSIHNCMKFYDYTRPWITHCSIQRTDLYKTAENTLEWRTRYGKPIVLDEIAYEGNIAFGWGNISGEEMTRRFWEAYTRGGYAMHGETYTHPRDILWWSHGGTLHGTSPSRIAFLKEIMEEAPGNGLEPVEGIFDESVAADRQGGYFLYYYGANRPSERDYDLPRGQTYQAEIIDTWEKTIEAAGTVSGRFTLTLPGKAYIAVRFRRVDS